MSIRDVECGSNTPPEKGEDYGYYRDPRRQCVHVSSPPARSFGDTIGSPSALALGAHGTTLTTLSCALMGFRGLSDTNVFVANFNFIAGIGMVVSAQWELVRGNSYAYTVLSGFGLFYAGFGALNIPFLGISAAYGSDTVQYNNASGFFVLLWGVFNFFFFLGSLPINLVYIGIFGFVELTFILLSASYFVTADGNEAAGAVLKTVAGAFAFCSGMCGYYTVGHLMCQEACFFSFPMGDTSRFFKGRKLNDQRPEPQHHELERG